MIKNLPVLLTTLLLFSCNGKRTVTDHQIITVSIPPIKYFIEEIADQDFAVNVMVPAGSNPHIYEPVPTQIDKLRRSEAYISNGLLGFELTWLDRFYEINRSMVRFSLGDYIVPILNEHSHESEHAEGADPHYWVSPKCVLKFILPIRDLLIRLNPAGRTRYEEKCDSLISQVIKVDSLAQSYFSEHPGGSFMIYHPNLAYLARDYGLEEIAVEFEGKEPNPSRLKELIDLARGKNIDAIFVQKEYDRKNAQAIADEIGADLVIIDPLSPDWYVSTIEIIKALDNSLRKDHN